MNMKLELKQETSPQWLDAVLNDFNLFLIDHAACERKASAMAMSMVAHYPDKEQLVKTMMNLAIEELAHFRQVVILMQKRHLILAPDTKDAYVGGLRKLMRSEREEYFLDRLLVGAIVEARGYERFAMIAESLEPGELQNFYKHIARSEARHYEIFLQLAELYFPVDLINVRLEELLVAEATIINQLPFTGMLH